MDERARARAEDLEGGRGGVLRRRRFLAGVLLLFGAAACAPRDEGGDPGDAASLARDRTTEAADEGGEPGDTIAGSNWTREDWQILEEKVRWAVAEGLDRQPVGEAVARLGATFVGTTYTPGTLEAPGPEHLVINLRELDCVTFVENVLALVWLVQNHGTGILADRPGAMRQFEEYLTALRYRGGALSGYPSRLHYFSEWLTDNESMGLVRVRTAELGGVPDPEPITFMGRNRSAYRQLADEGFYQEILRIEQRLNASGPRYYIPQNAIPQAEAQIRNGDVIAATSTVGGLDVAHTGFAYWKDGRLHLMHAPLVGKNVEISELPLAQRILGISGQDGIMVATPQAWPGSRPTTTSGR